MAAPIFKILIGIPGSGKSRWVKENAGDDEIVCPDEIRWTMFKDQPYSSDWNPLIWFAAKYSIINNLKKGRNVILDATNVTTRLRHDVLLILPSKCKKWAVLFPVDPDVAYCRIQKDMKRGCQRADVREDYVYKAWGEFEYTRKIINNEGYDRIIEAE